MIYRWKNIVLSSIPILTVAAMVELIAGHILQGNSETLFMIPVFLISIPVINSVGGNIGSILGARLASGLHVGTITYNFHDKSMHKNLCTSLLLGLVTYTLLAILIYSIAYLGNIQIGIGLPEFTAVFIITGMMLVVLISIISVFTALISFKKGLDPDDVVAPVVTTLGDTFGIIFLMLIIGVTLL